ncbi:MAG TPA: ATP-binding protein [Chroococcales cyanobacterium]
MKLNLRLNQKATAIVLIPFLIQIGLFLLYNDCMRQVEALAEQEHHSKNVIGHANWLSTLVCTATLSLTAHAHSGKCRFLANYRSESGKILEELSTLQKLVSNNREEAKNCSDLVDSTSKFLDQLRAAEAIAQSSGPGYDPLSSPRFARSFAQVFRSRSRLLAAEKKHHAGELQAAAARRKQTEQFIGFGIGLNVAAALVLITLFSRNIAARLQLLTDNTIRLARKQPLKPRCKGDDEIARLDSVFHNMAEALAAASKREHAVLEHAADVICSLDSSGRITEINPACLSAWGYQQRELIGKFFLEYVRPKHQEETAAALSKGAKSNEPFSFENQIVREDGALVSISWSVYWSENENSYFCVAHDITKQKYVEQLKAQFTSMVSHDLRTPLSSILSFLDLLHAGAHGTLSQESLRSVALVQRSTRRLIRLVNDLLDLDRLESGGLPLEMREVDIKDIVDEALSSTRDLASAAGVKIDDSYVRPQKVKADPARITQVLVNLLSNSIKFSPTGANVTIVSSRRDGFVNLSVIDTGRGIPDHLKAVLFDRFKQIEVNDARSGSGLGLAICKTIVEQHGGKMGVDSRVGLGSCFWFKLPVEMDEEETADSFEPAAGALAVHEPAGLVLCSPSAPGSESSQRLAC